MDSTVRVAHAVPSTDLIYFRAGVRGCKSNLIVNLKNVTHAFKQHNEPVIVFNITQGQFAVSFHSEQECIKAYEWVGNNFAARYG